MVELKSSCFVGSKEFVAPKGWKFGQCDTKQVSMFRTKDAGNWSIDFDDPNDNTTPKDEYILASEYQNWGAWQIDTYTPRGGSGEHFIRANKRSVAIKEMLCLANATEVDEAARKAGDEKSLDKFSESLEKCRNKNKIETTDYWTHTTPRK